MGCPKFTYHQQNKEINPFLRIWRQETKEPTVVFSKKVLAKKGQPSENRVEYHPFGTTSYRSGRNTTETSLKRYRYVGKERDEETGLYYYGARYYAAWLARFVSTDPLKDEYPFYTSYQYAGNKPTNFIDLDGLETTDNNTTSVQKNGQEAQHREGDKILEERKVTVSNGGPESIVLTEEATKYYHEGSESDGKTYEAGFYSTKSYKEILTGTRDNADNSLPLNVNTILKDIAGSKTPITEKDLSVDELISLSGIVNNALSKGSDKIQYADYQTSKDGDKNSDVAGGRSGKGYGDSYSAFDKLKDSTYSLKSTLGQAGIAQENGEVFVRDTYDFNEAAEAQKDKGFLDKAGAYYDEVKQGLENSESSGKKAYIVFRSLGTYFGSPEGEGIPVNIKVPQILLNRRR